MKAQLIRRVCCGCIEAVAEASSSPPPQQPVSFIEMSPRPPRPPLPPPASSLAATVKKTSPAAISSTSSSNSSSSIGGSRKVEELIQEKRDEDEDGFLGRRHAPPPVVVKPSAAPVPDTTFSSSTFVTFPPANPRPGPNEPSLLQQESEEEHPTDTRTRASTSTSQIPIQSPLVPTSKNWAAAYILASPTPPPADPVRESFIARLVEGVPVIKHNRKGQSRVRELCTLDNGETFTWREEGVGGDKAGGHRRHRSSAGSSLFGGAREAYAFGDIIEVSNVFSRNGRKKGRKRVQAGCVSSFLL